MSKEILFSCAQTMLLVAFLVLSFRIGTVRAQATIYIRADGSIDPPTAPIRGDGSLYTLTSDILSSIVIERSDILVDGNGYTIQGDGTGSGFYWDSLDNVTLKSANIREFEYGIYLHNSSDSTVLSNNITNSRWAGVELDSSPYNVISMNDVIANNFGIQLSHSHNNIVSENQVSQSNGMYSTGINLGESDFNSINENNITQNRNGGIWLLWSSYNHINNNNVEANPRGIYFDSSSYNVVSGNHITKNGCGVSISDSHYNRVNWNDIRSSIYDGIIMSNSSNNRIFANNVTENEDGIFLCGWGGTTNNRIFLNNMTSNTNAAVRIFNSPRNAIFQNNIVNNTNQVIFVGEPFTNEWDNGYPSGGNYWDDYIGLDIHSGPNQNQSGIDGIGDTPYIINEENVDNYPYVNPCQFHVGDLTRDGTVDIQDIAIASAAFGSYPNHPRWNPSADINHNSRIDITDVAMTCASYGWH